MKKYKDLRISVCFGYKKTMQNNIVPASYLYVTALNMEGVRKYTSVFSVRKTSSKEEKQEMRGVEYKSLELGNGGRMQPARIPWPARGSAWPSGDLKWGWGPRRSMGAPARMTKTFCKDPLGKKVCIKCNTDDTVSNLRKLTIAQTGPGRKNIVLKKWYTIL